MNIEELRNELASVDDQMLELFIRHLELTQLIGRIKAEEGKGLYDRKSEEELLEKVVANSPQDMQSYTLQLFREVMNLSKEHFKYSK